MLLFLDHLVNLGTDIRVQNAEPFFFSQQSNGKSYYYLYFIYDKIKLIKNDLLAATKLICDIWKFKMFLNIIAKSFSMLLPVLFEYYFKFLHNFFLLLDIQGNTMPGKILKSNFSLVCMAEFVVLSNVFHDF